MEVSPPPSGTGEVVHRGKATSFADNADVRAFKLCKAQGKTDQQCYDVGDSGVGYWNDSTVEGTGPSCALIPQDIIERWGSLSAGKHKPVEVTIGQARAVCILKDVMPHHPAHGAVIDLNPDACHLLDVDPPLLTDVSWRWA
jgi:hypothetical protein